MQPEVSRVSIQTNSLIIKNLSVRYGQIEAVRDVSLEVKKGEIVTVLGANGAGKTSLLRAIIGVESPISGTVSADDQDITALSTSARVSKGVVLVPEGRRILINQTIHENLLLGATARKDAHNFKADADEIYEKFPNLHSRKNMAAACLSGGEQQMLAIGRAIMAKPKILMLDEPSLGLSPIVVNQMFNLLQELNDQEISILLVEQNTGKALSLAHRAYVMEHGAITVSGNSQDILSDPKLQGAYLGE